MRALLLAAGYGNRLRPLTDIIPKCMVPVNGRPLLAYWLQMLGQEGFTSVLVNLHYMADFVSEFIALSSDAPFVSTVYEPHLLGTGGTLLANRNFFRDEPLLLVHADNLCRCDLREFIDSHYRRPPGCDITMMTFRSMTPETCGIVKVDDRGIVRAFYEKVTDPPGNLANGAVYIIEPSVFDVLSRMNKKVIDFSLDVLPLYMGKTYTYLNDVYHRDIGNINSLLDAQNTFPYPLTFSGGRDFWLETFLKDSRRARNILCALAGAKESAIFTHESDFVPLPYNEPNSDGHASNCVLLAFETIPEDISDIHVKAQRRWRDKELIFFFKQVPMGFMSHSLFGALNIRSFSLCACQTGENPYRPLTDIL
jgi:mannose-1-phosphate guanylyltransferase